MLVSAGFDAHRADPLATCGVTEAGFAAMTASVRRARDAVGAPVGLVLEGGYDLGALAGSMAALMPVLTADEPLAARRVERHPLAATRLFAAGAVVAGAQRRVNCGIEGCRRAPDLVFGDPSRCASSATRRQAPACPPSAVDVVGRRLGVADGVAVGEPSASAVLGMTCRT